MNNSPHEFYCPDCRSRRAVAILLRKAAWSAYRKARKLGLLQKQPCEVCGNPNAGGHHDDYGKPLEVVWLCGRHHVQRHNERGRMLISCPDEFRNRPGGPPPSLAKAIERGLVNGF